MEKTEKREKPIEKENKKPAEERPMTFGGSKTDHKSYKMEPKLDVKLVDSPSKTFSKEF